MKMLDKALALIGLRRISRGPRDVEVRLTPVTEDFERSIREAMRRASIATRKTY